MNNKVRSSVGFLPVLLLLTWFVSSVFAEDQKKEEPLVLTVEQAVSYATQNSRTLKSNAIDLEIKKRADKYSWNVFLPAVQASGTMSRVNDYASESKTYAELLNPLYARVGIPVSIPTEAASESDNWVAVGNIGVSLNLSLALIQNIKAAHADYEAGVISWDSSVKENELNVRKLFYGLLLQQENLKLQETTLQNAEQRSKQSEINYKNGLVPELSMLQAEVTYENQRPSVEKTRQSVDQQLDTFAFLLGLPVGTKIQLEGAIDPVFIDLDADSLYRRYGESNLDVVSLKKNIAVLETNLSALNLSSYTPAVSLSWGYQPVLSDISADWTEKDNWIDNGSLSLTLAWNLTNMLPFSSNRQQAQDLKDSIRKLEISMDTVRQNNELEVKRLVDQLEQSREQILSSERSIKLAQKSYDMTAAAYRNGTMELLDLRDAETQLNQAKFGLLNSKYEYLSNMLDLENILNTKLKGDENE